MAVDLRTQRLFVAELGNNSIGVVDLKKGVLSSRIRGLSEPQGIGFVDAQNLLVVANAGNGSISFFRANDLGLAGNVQTSGDADNVRVSNGKVFVGYGNGGIVMIDPERMAKVGDHQLPAHPEGFQVHPESGTVFANIPRLNAIAAIDPSGSVSRWPLEGASGAFPMALSAAQHSLFVVARTRPAQLVRFDIQSKKTDDRVETCDDADDVFIDEKRHRAYVTCGSGVIDVFNISGSPKRIDTVKTRTGARTSLYVEQLDRLFVAARAGPEGGAEILEFRPQ